MKTITVKLTDEQAAFVEFAAQNYDCSRFPELGEQSDEAHGITGLVEQERRLYHAVVSVCREEGPLH